MIPPSPVALAACPFAHRQRNRRRTPWHAPPSCGTLKGTPQSPALPGGLPPMRFSGALLLFALSGTVPLAALPDARQARPRAPS